MDRAIVIFSFDGLDRFQAGQAHHTNLRLVDVVGPGEPCGTLVHPFVERIGHEDGVAVNKPWLAFRALSNREPFLQLEEHFTAERLADRMGNCFVVLADAENVGNNLPGYWLRICLLLRDFPRLNQIPQDLSLNPPGCYCSWSVVRIAFGFGPIDYQFPSAVRTLKTALSSPNRCSV
jgi:hypothetical protein